jgi:peptidoglycan L-alanyl-D-glutamate endopeptidase CwlK
MMDRSLSSLSPAFRPIAYAFLAKLVEAGIAVMIINTRRTKEEQAVNFANGTSWVKHSKHEEGNAIDLCPYELYTAAAGGDKLAWNAEHPVWDKIGQIGESLGLVWGGRWTKRDMGHFELPKDLVVVHFGP